MLPVPFNPNVVSLNPVNNRFDATLPARLVGIITPNEFAASIARCNEALSRGPINMARLVIFIGMVVWGICFGIAFGTMGRHKGPDLALVFVGIGFMVVCTIGGSLWSRLIMRDRVTGLQAAVAAEHNYYNSPAHVQQRGVGAPPMSWTMMDLASGYQRRHGRILVQINIDIGGQFQYAPHAIMQQPQYHQPAPPPYAPGVYQPTPNAFSAQPQYGAPLLPTAHETSEGDPVTAPIAAIAIGVCDRCNKTTNNPQDRFCTSCGGPYRR